MMALCICWGSISILFNVLVQPQSLLKEIILHIMSSCKV